MYFVIEHVEYNVADMVVVLEFITQGHHVGTVLTTDSLNLHPNSGLAALLYHIKQYVRSSAQIPQRM
jgi:hypothetical protein